MNSIKAKTILDTIERYNKRFLRKIYDTKEDNLEFLEQRRRFEETFDNDTYMSGLGSDPIVHREFLLSVISYYQEMKLSIIESIEMKQKVNNNPGKIAVLKRLLRIQSESTPSTKQPDSSPSANSPFLGIKDTLESPKQPMELCGSVFDQPSETELEALIEAAEAEQTRLSNSLTALESRNKTLSSELTKATEYVVVAHGQNIDAKIDERSQEMADINQEIEILTSC